MPTLSDDPRYSNIRIVEEDGRLDDWAVRRQAGEVIQATLSRSHRRQLRRVFLEHQTKSFVSVPILLRDRWWGFLGFDDCVRERALERAGDRHPEDRGGADRRRHRAHANPTSACA